MPKANAFLFVLYDFIYLQMFRKKASSSLRMRRITESARCNDEFISLLIRKRWISVQLVKCCVVKETTLHCITTTPKNVTNVKKTCRYISKKRQHDPFWLASFTTNYSQVVYILTTLDVQLKTHCFCLKPCMKESVGQFRWFQVTGFCFPCFHCN